MGFLSGYAKKLGVLEYLGVWDASTNTPALVNGVGNKGGYYVVSVSGTTNLDSVSDWQPGDWVIFNGTSWQKIDTTDQVSSVSGRKGDVVLTKSDVDLSNVPNIDATSRENHTGTQLASTISDFATAVQATGSYITSLTGDVTASGPGLATATLSDSGVTAGTYNLVTVDAKGRVTSASNSGPVTRFSYVSSATDSTTQATYITVAALTTASLPAGIYRFSFYGNMQSGSTNSGVGVRVAPVSATMTTVSAKWNISQGANGVSHDFEYDQIANNTNVTSASVVAANSTFAANGSGVFRLTTPGTVAIQIRAETANQAASLLADAAFTVELL